MSKEQIMEGNELKPCPFCGGKAAMKSHTECGGFGSYSEIVYIKCLECGARGPEADSFFVGSKTDLNLIATTKWNRREDNEQRKAD